MSLTCSPQLLTIAIAGFVINAAVLAQEPESEPQPVVEDTPITAVFLCTSLLACSIGTMASADEPSDQVTDSTIDDISFGSISELDFELALGQEDAGGADGLELALGEEKSEDAAAASNPLSSASNLDFRLDYFDLDGSKDRIDISVRGATLLHPKVKLAFEVHYWSTDITGTTEDDWERVVIRPIYFIKDVKLSDRWGMRLATGVEFSFDAGNADKGIGSGSDQIAPLFGIAFNNRDSGLTLIPFVQQFLSYDGPSVNITAFRLIALQPLPDSMWLRLDTKLPFDWENDTVPASFEVELGKMFEGWGVYGTGFVGIGGDRLYDWGVGAGVRFSF